MIVNFADRSTECYALSKTLMLDSNGKVLRQTNCPLFWFDKIFDKQKDGIKLREVM